MWPLKSKKHIINSSNSKLLPSKTLIKSLNSLIYENNIENLNNNKYIYSINKIKNKENIKELENGINKIKKKKEKKISNSKILNLIMPQHFFHELPDFKTKLKYIGKFNNKQRSFIYTHFLLYNLIYKNSDIINIKKIDRKEFVEFEVSLIDRLVIEYLLRKKRYKNEKEIFLIFKKICNLSEIKIFFKSNTINNIILESNKNIKISKNIKHILCIINYFWIKFKSITINILELLITDYNILSIIKIHDLKNTFKLMKSKLFWLKCDTVILMNLKFNDLENFLKNNLQNSKNFKKIIKLEEFSNFLIKKTTFLNNEFNLNERKKEFNLNENIKKIKSGKEEEYFDFLISLNASIDSYTRNINFLHNEIIKKDKLIENKNLEIEELNNKLKNRKKKYNLFI